jgi:D-alanine-D-alanine ligase
MGRESRGAIHAILSKHYSDVSITIVNNLSDLNALVARKPDLVFLGMKFIYSNKDLGLLTKIWITQYLDEHGIAYTGSNQTAHALERNKALAKQCVLDAGLNTSAFYIEKQNYPQPNQPINLSFPMFIKPLSGGGGQGIDSASIAYNFNQLQIKIRSIADKLKSDSIIEEYLPGREFSVAIMKKQFSDEYLTMPIELITVPDNNGARILGKQVKSANAEQAVKVVNVRIHQLVSELAIKVFYALGARDYGRIDVRLDKFGTPQFLEANLIPSLINGYGSFPKACYINMGIPHEAIVLRITKLGLARNLEFYEEPLSDSLLLNSALS